jgi:hypothetical protein
VVVEHRLLDRDRQRLLRAVADRVLELLGVVDSCDLEDPDADPVVGDAEAHALARKLVLAEERAQRVGEKHRLAQLATDDDPVLEVVACDLNELGAAVVHDARGCELRGADLEADEALRPLRSGATLAARAGLARLFRLRLLLLLASGALLLRLLRRPRLLRLAPERDLLLQQRDPFGLGLEV